MRMHEGPAQSWTETVGYEYGGFALAGSDEPDAKPGSREYRRVVERTFGTSSAEISRLGQEIFIGTPHLSNYDVSLVVELWNKPPEHDEDQWQAVLSSSLFVDEQLNYDSPTIGTTYFDVPRGLYMMRVCGAGFVEAGYVVGGSLGDEADSDWWRVQLWPTNEHAPPRVEKQWDGLPYSGNSAASAGRSHSQHASANEGDLDAAGRQEQLSNLVNDAYYRELDQFDQPSIVVNGRDWGSFTSDIVIGWLRTLVVESDESPREWDQEKQQEAIREFLALSQAVPLMPPDMRASFKPIQEIGELIMRDLGVLDANVGDGAAG